MPLAAATVTCGCSPASTTDGRGRAVIQKDVPVQGEWVERSKLRQCADSASGERLPDSPGLSRRRIRQKGRLLFEIDPRPFQAVLDQAKGQLAQAEAQMANAERNVKRDIPEAEAHAIPQSQLDTDTQSLRGAKAELRPAKRRSNRPS